MNIIQLNDSDAEYGPYLFQAPTGMDIGDAKRLLDALVVYAKDEHPGDYQFDDLLAVLEPRGFIFVPVTVASEVW